jgi:glucose-6-phosphate isomerase
MAIDKLWYMDALQVRAGLGVTISTPEALLHQNFTTYLEQARIEDEGFDELDTTAKRAVLLALAQVDNAEIEAGRPTPNITANLF